MLRLAIDIVSLIFACLSRDRVRGHRVSTVRTCGEVNATTVTSATSSKTTLSLFPGCYSALVYTRHYISNRAVGYWQKDRLLGQLCSY